MAQVLLVVSLVGFVENVRSNLQISNQYKKKVLFYFSNGNNILKNTNGVKPIYNKR